MLLDNLEFKSLVDKVLEKVARELEISNRTNELESYLRKIGCGEFIAEHNTEYTHNAKIVIIGESAIDVKEIESVAKKNGINPKRLELCLNYEKIKSIDIRRFEYNCNYSDIIFGPVPHKMVGIDDNSSAIAMIKNSSKAYPKLNLASDGNSLKITKKSLDNCFKNTQYYLDMTA